MEVLMVYLAVVGSFQALVMCLGFIIALIITIILPILLFFKVWRMCNDVREIKEIFNSKKNG